MQVPSGVLQLQHGEDDVHSQSTGICPHFQVVKCQVTFSRYNRPTPPAIKVFATNSFINNTNSLVTKSHLLESEGVL